MIDQVSRKDAKEAAAAAVAAEAETDEVLENAFSGLKFSQDEEESDNHSDMSLERENMAQDIVSIASSVNSMALEEARPGSNPRNILRSRHLSRSAKPKPKSPPLTRFSMIRSRRRPPVSSIPSRRWTTALCGGLNNR